MRVTCSLLFSLMLLLTVVSSVGHYHDLSEQDHSECSLCTSSFDARCEGVESGEVVEKVSTFEFVLNSYHFIVLHSKSALLDLLKARAPPVTWFS